MLPGVEHVVRVSKNTEFSDGITTTTDQLTLITGSVRFGQDTLNVFAGLCAVDSPVRGVEGMMKALGIMAGLGWELQTAHSRTLFRGHGRIVSPLVFRLAGKYTELKLSPWK